MAAVGDGQTVAANRDGRRDLVLHLHLDRPGARLDAFRSLVCVSVSLNGRHTAIPLEDMGYCLVVHLEGSVLHRHQLRGRAEVDDLDRSASQRSGHCGIPAFILLQEQPEGSLRRKFNDDLVDSHELNANHRLRLHPECAKYERQDTLVGNVLVGEEQA